MRNIMRFLALVLLSLCVGCATVSSNLNKVSVGMTKEQVIEILGEPDTKAAKGDIEVLTYNHSIWSYNDWHLVALRNGTVEGFQ